MKFIIAIVLTALFSFIGGLYLPWWNVAIVAFAVCALLRQRAAASFFSAFLGVFLLWLALTMLIDIKNQSLLSEKIGELLGVGPHSSLIILISALVGGLVAGMAGWCASYLYPEAMKREKYGT